MLFAKSFSLLLSDNISFGLYVVLFCLMTLSISCGDIGYKSRSIGKLTNGRKEGVWEIYDDKGGLKERNTYKNDTLNGPQLTFDRNGKIYTKAFYKMGIFIDSFRLYFDNGQIRSESWFDSLGREQGIYKVYHKNGQLSEIGRSVNGATVDTAKGYDESGHLQYLEIYKMGSKEKSITYFDKEGVALKIEYYKGDSLYAQNLLNGR